MKPETKSNKKKKKQAKPSNVHKKEAGHERARGEDSGRGTEKTAASSPLSGAPRWRRFIWVLPVILGFFLYSGIYDHRLVHWDDVLMIQWAQREPFSLDYVWNIMTKIGRTYQPVRDISYSIDARLFDEALWGYFLHNVLLYCLNVWLVYLIVGSLMRRFGSTHTERGQVADEAAVGEPAYTGAGVAPPWLVAMLTTLLFAVHPLHVESVAWLAARKEVLCGLFFFLSFWFFLQVDVWDGRKRLIGVAASFFSYILALLSKPTAASLPLIILASDLILVRPSLRQWKKRIWIHLPFWLPAVGAGFYFSLVAGTTKTILADLPLFQRLVHVNVVLAHYLKTMVIPLQLSARYAFDWNISPTDPAVLVGAAMQVASVVCFIWLWRRSRIAAFWIAWFYINFLPTSGIIPIAIQAADRYIFISSLAYCGLATLAVLKLGGTLFSSSRKAAVYVAVGVLICLVAVYSVLTVRQSRVWRDDMTLWTHTAKVTPSDLSLYSLGEAYRRRNDMKMAKHYYELSLDANPRFVQSLNGLGNVMLLEKDIRKAETLYLKALEVDPNYSHAHRHLAIVYITLRDFDRALEHAEKALRSYSQDEVLLDMLCLLYLTKGDPYKLRETATRLYDFESERVSALIYLFRAYQAFGDLGRAMKFRGEAYELNPGEARKMERKTAAAREGYR